VDGLMGAGNHWPVVRAPLYPASDVSGEVVAVGSNVKDLKIGDQVFASTEPLPIPGKGPTGRGLAEFCEMNYKQACLLPKGMSHATAASLPLVSLEA